MPLSGVDEIVHFEAITGVAPAPTRDPQADNGNDDVSQKLMQSFSNAIHLAKSAGGKKKQRYRDWLVELYPGSHRTPGKRYQQQRMVSFTF